MPGCGAGKGRHRTPTIPKEINAMDYCGSERGFRTHKANNERPCKWCLIWKEKHDAGMVKVVEVKQPKQRKARTATAGKPAPKLQPCGTNAGYQRHRRHKEIACEPCKKAAAAYRKKLDDQARAKKGLKPAQDRTEWLSKHPTQCGTPAGRHRHKRHGEPVCEPCRLAYNEQKRIAHAAKRAEKRKAAA